jgi:NitT/TauT family transport system substrate-binding protein
LGTPVDLTVVYQPYFTESWSALVLRSKRFYERYLPAGSAVHWELALHGPVVLRALREGRADLGYLGDVPAVAIAGHPETVDIRLIAATGLSRNLCANLLVRADAPNFAGAQAAIAWLDGKRVAASHGGCTDRFAQQIFDIGRIHPSEYLNLTQTVLRSGFSMGRLDAAAVQEPIAAQLVLAGLARSVVTGADLGTMGTSFLVIRADLLMARPDITQAWLEAELDAELYMAAPEHAEEIARIAEAQTIGYDRDVLWTALYGTRNDALQLSFPFAFTEEVRAQIDQSVAFLHATGRTGDEHLRVEAIMDATALSVLSKRGLTAPIGDVQGRSIQIGHRP